MKTTVEISDALYAKARKLAEKQGVPFRQVLETALRTHVERQAAAKPKPFKFTHKPFHGRGLQPGIPDLNWDHLRDLVYPIKHKP